MHQNQNLNQAMTKIVLVLKFYKTILKLYLEILIVRIGKTMFWGGELSLIYKS